MAHLFRPFPIAQSPDLLPRGIKKEAEMVVRGVEQMDIAIVKAYAQDLRGLLEEAEFTERKAFVRSSKG